MRRIFVVSCLLTFALVVFAQDGQRGNRGGFRMSPEARAQWYETLKKDLSLTDKQFADFKKIDEEYITKQREAREKAGDNREAMREEFTKLRTEQNVKVKKLFSAEQYKKYEEMLSQRRQGGGNRQN